MGTYNVEFSGKLLAGFDPQEVRLHAATRLRMSEAQLDRVFDGRPIVLKKAVDATAGQRYLGELHRLGMASRLVELDAAPPPAQSVATFKVVFTGQLVEGFDRDAVAVAAARRLSIGPEQVTRLFSGKKVVLKRGVSERLGRRYMAELAGIGMQTTLVDEQSALVSPPEPPAAAPAPTPVVLEPAAFTLPSPQAKVAGAIPDLEEAGGEHGRISPVSEAQLAALTATQFEMPQHLLASGELPEPMDDSIDHAATLLVDPARLVEQMNYAPPPLVEPVVEKPGALDTDRAVPYVRCAQCNHSQPAASRCRRCGAVLEGELAVVLAPALQVLSVAEPVAPVPPPPASAPASLQGLTLEPLAAPAPAEEVEAVAPPPAPAVAPAPAVTHRAPSLAASFEASEEAGDEAGSARRTKLLIGGAVLLLLLLILVMR